MVVVVVAAAAGGNGCGGGNRNKGLDVSQHGGCVLCSGQLAGCGAFCALACFPGVECVVCLLPLLCSFDSVVLGGCGLGLG